MINDMRLTILIIAVAWVATASRAQAIPASTNTVASPFRVQLPAKPLVFPEPLSAGQRPGFKFRGTKGWAWTPEQYEEEIPWLAKYKMNFLMNCYSSLFTSTHPWINEWWKPLPDSTRTAFAKIIHDCHTNGIIFCFCMNPQLRSKRPLNPADSADIDRLYQHYAWAQSVGVRWFSICVDDVQWTQHPALIAEEDAKMVNTILARLREKDPRAQMIFCPGPYQGEGTKPDDYAYLHALALDLAPDVYVFWTGDDTVTPRITFAAAQSYQATVKHRLFLWDNYPVNDGHPTLNLGPVSGRAPDLCRLIDGYMGNPMGTENQINRLPLATCADYSYNPVAYDPARSIGQAIVLLGKNHAQQKVLKELVEVYPGFLVTGGDTGTNPVRTQFQALAAEPNSRAAQEFLSRMEALAAESDTNFPGQFGDAKKNIAADIAWMKQRQGSK